MRETAKVIKQLIMKGSINDREDRELFSYASDTAVQDELDVFAEEWRFYIIRMAHDMYLVPLQDNEMFNVKLREIRENVGSVARNTDAYLQCYIVMVILYMLFGSKNGNPQSAQSLRIKDIVEKLDERFENNGEAVAMEEDMHINFRVISDIWNNKAIVNEGRKSSKTELVKTACRFLISQKLLEFRDDEDEIRPLNRLTNIMCQYYLNEKRISQINEIFEKEDCHATD